MEYTVKHRILTLVVQILFGLFLASSDGDEVAHSKPLPLKNTATAATMTALTLILFFVLITSFDLSTIQREKVSIDKGKKFFRNIVVLTAALQLII